MPALPDCPCDACADYRRRFGPVPGDVRYSGVTFNDSTNRWESTEREAMPTFDELDGPDDEDMEDNEDLVPCGYCGQRFDTDELVRAEDRWFDRSGAPVLYCLDCVESCPTCDEYFRYLSDHMSSYCDECGEYQCPDVSMSYCRNCDTNVCDDCGGGCGGCNAAVRSYDWRPPQFNFKGDKSQVMLGIELEVEGREGAIVAHVHEYDDCENHLYMKHDGSVDGVEIVTHPATLEWTRNEFDWDSLLCDMSDDSDCHINRNENGLHVHVARDSFAKAPGAKRSTRHQMSWLMFLYRNADELQSLARRQGGRWASFDAPSRGELKRKATRPDRSNRYVAVNCNNEHTYELRFFASTLSTVEFYAAVELADASVEYTRQLRASDVLTGDGLSWPAFIAWADNQGGRYAALVAESNRRVPRRPVTRTARPTSASN